MKSNDDFTWKPKSKSQQKEKPIPISHKIPENCEILFLAEAGLKSLISERNYDILTKKDLLPDLPTRRRKI